MEPLNLRLQPPRSPRAELGGLLFLARTVDKLRTSLPGGDLGEYQLKGFNHWMLEALGVSEDQLREVVATAANDDDVVAWVLNNTTAQAREHANAVLLEPTLASRLERPDFLAKYPVAATLPPELPLLDFLDHDDRACFDKLSMTQG